MAQELIGGVYRSLFRAAPGPLRSGLDGRVRSRLNLARSYLLSYYQSRRDPDWFHDIGTYCMFIGHARSGGSLIGGLLDAHPNVILADEVDIFPYVSAGFNREQIYQILRRRSQQQAQKGRLKAGRDATTYSYQVPGQWQGKSDQPRVIGNRKAGISTQWLGQDLGLLQDLQDILGSVPVRLILTIRNPYDTISTMNLRSGRALTSGLEQYFSNCETIDSILNTRGPADLLVLRHEDFLADPREHLRGVCDFLGLEAPDDYLEDCTRVLFKAPAESRRKVDWSDELIAGVKSRIDEFEFLRGYSYE